MVQLSPWRLTTSDVASHYHLTERAFFAIFVRLCQRDCTCTRFRTRSEPSENACSVVWLGGLAWPRQSASNEAPYEPRDEKHNCELEDRAPDDDTSRTAGNYNAGTLRSLGDSEEDSRRSFDLERVVGDPEVTVIWLTLCPG
jgi:hypothetical protein